MLKNGTFTTVAATELTADSYDDTNKTYELVNVVNKTTTTGVTFNNTAYTGADGILSFVGLGEGEYTITELAAPEGYNTLSTPITITIEATLDQTEQTCTWTVTKGDDELAPDNDHLYTFEVENNQGIILPGTGGIGTTIFYIVGGIFILGAAALLLTKIRSKRK
jgi:LPXTG-motif cell wall-anchored protein